MPFNARGLTREQIADGIRRAVRCLSGREVDPSGAVRDLQLAMGVALLGQVQDNFRVQSEGGAGELGTGPWEPLAASTLALRRKDASGRVIDRIKRDLGRLPAHRQRLIQEQFRRALAVYRAEDLGSLSGGKARRAARGILERMRRYLTPARYKQLRGELSRQQKPDRAARLALAAAASLILRDSGRLFNSLSPGLRGAGDQILRAEPGAIVVGTNSTVAKYHQSRRPRKQKRDGSGPRLPRRQFLPDEDTPLPDSWHKALAATLSEGLQSDRFWRQFLGRSS